ncbi:MAG TPA: response regulator [Polyangiaceae bacterium]
MDDDAAQLAVVREALERAGYAVRDFTDAQRALEECALEAPALVISDVMMPEVGGFELQATYARRFPERSTPFVFLSSASDASTIARGLDAGADDFLQKPIDSSVLEAKVRAILRRRWRAAQNSFRGDLRLFPLSRLLRFCETQGLTGFVDFFIGDTLRSLRFKAGQMDDPAAEETLGHLTDLDAAPFVVHSAAVDFAELGSPKRRSVPPGPERAMGRVSSVRLNKKVFLIQTELAGDPPQFMVSVVLVDGRTAWKHSELVAADLAPSAISESIDRVHEHIEKKLTDHMAEKLLGHAGHPGRRQEFHALFDEGFDQFRARDFAAAIRCWERALELEPGNAALLVNLKIARQKIAPA